MIDLSYRLTCSRCGNHLQVQISESDADRAIRLGWNSCGSALYCPHCTATWSERNGDRPMGGKGNTFRVIMGMFLNDLIGLAEAQDETITELSKQKEDQWLYN